MDETRLQYLLIGLALGMVASCIAVLRGQGALWQGLFLGATYPVLTRLAYVVRLLVIAGMFAGILYAIGMPLAADSTLEIDSWLGVVLLWPIVTYSLTGMLQGRLRDAALNPALAWLSVLPLINVVVYLAACLPSSKPSLGSPARQQTVV